MLSQEVLERLSEKLIQRTQELNYFMINKLAEQIKTIGSLTPSQAREILQSIQYGADLEEIINELARITNLNVKEIYMIFDEVAENAQFYAKPFYEYRNILEYVDGGYVITNKISDKNLEEMRANMDESDVDGFDEFVEKHWGNKMKKTKKVKIEE